MPTVILSQSPSLDPRCRTLEEDILRGLESVEGIEVLVVPHLYYLVENGAVLARLRAIEADVIVLAWLFPRAARWIVETRRTPSGQSEDTPASAAEEARNLAATAGRTIHCLDLGASDDPEIHLAEVRRLVAASARPDAMSQRASSPAAKIVRLEEATARRWYPVIDYDHCTNCLECLDFCLFGVYGVDEADTIVVDEPDACRKGCPACSRVCPTGAILFPQHKNAAIAGSSDSAARAKLDLSALLSLADPVEIARRERDAARAAEGQDEATEPRRTDEAAKPSDDLDRLMDELDEFER
ncbi:MAG: ferredoxin family protein [Pirellulales bacterium]